MVSLGKLYQGVLINQDGSEYNLAHPLLSTWDKDGFKVQRFRGSSPPWPLSELYALYALRAGSRLVARDPTPRRVRLDVAMKLLSHSMGLVFHPQFVNRHSSFHVVSYKISGRLSLFYY
jgi:hypothetical protein